MLEDCGLKSSTSKLTIKEANPRYKDCFDSQVIGSNPKQGTVVKIGSTVCLRYIPDEVIIESQKIFDELQRNKKNPRNALEKIFRLLRKGQNRAWQKSLKEITKKNNRGGYAKWVKAEKEEEYSRIDIGCNTHVMYWWIMVNLDIDTVSQK